MNEEEKSSGLSDYEELKDINQIFEDNCCIYLSILAIQVFVSTDVLNIMDPNGNMESLDWQIYRKIAERADLITEMKAVRHYMDERVCQNRH